MTSPAVATDDAYRKRLATVQAKAALAGVALHRLEDGRLLAARWGLTREFDTTDDVARFLAEMGGA